MHLAITEARAAGTAARTDRPQQRRAGEDPGSPRASITRAAPRLVEVEPRVEVRDTASGGKVLSFTGLASATGIGYQMYDVFGEYVEIVKPGAFGETLARTDLDVPLVLDHKRMQTIARTTVPKGKVGNLRLDETDDGLRARADLDPADPDVEYIAAKIKSGLIDEMSFRFRITSGEWSPDWTQYVISKVDIHRGDVAICGYGANPHTVATVRSAPDLLALIGAADEPTARTALDALHVRFAPVAAVVVRTGPLRVTEADLAPWRSSL